MRWIVLATVALLSACQQTAEPPKTPPPSDPKSTQAGPPPAPKPVETPKAVAPAPEVPSFYADSPYKDTIAVAHVNLGKSYAVFKQYLAQDGWITGENVKCIENVKHPNAKVLCETVPEIFACASETQCNVLWIKKNGPSVVIELSGNMVDINNTSSTSSLVIRKFTFFGISEKNQEVPDPAERFEQQMRPVVSQPPVSPQQPISPTPN